MPGRACGCPAAARIPVVRGGCRVPAGAFRRRRMASNFRLRALASGGMPAAAYAENPGAAQFRRGICDQTCVQDMLDTPFYIACLRLRGRRCVVVGGGEIGLEKVEELLACAGDVTLIAPESVDELRALAAEGSIHWEQRSYAGAAD